MQGIVKHSIKYMNIGTDDALHMWSTTLACFAVHCWVGIEMGKESRGSDECRMAGNIFVQLALLLTLRQN